MGVNSLLDNLTNPALLFFVLGIVAVRIKSDLEIPKNSSRFISIYLLFSIGFKGGQELSHSLLDWQIVVSILFGIFLAASIPIYVFFLVKKKLGVENAGAIAAAYGSISAVTFITAIAFLDTLSTEFNGYMIAVMALMEAPAIIVGVFLMKKFNKQSSGKSLKEVMLHALTNGSVILIVGSLIIGFLATESQAEGIKPFTTDIFKGFLVLFLLDMGIVSGKQFKSFIDSKLYAILIAIALPLVNGAIVAYFSGYIIESSGDRFLFSILAASASYIAVPAAMRLAAPKANPGIYLTMALAITFPVNITLGFPLYYAIIS
jgi:hypothetical protein